MAQKKRPAKKKKKTKKQKQQQEQLLTIFVGFALILFAAFGFLRLGFLGTLVANGFRIFAGNTYPILCLLLAITGFWIIIKNTELKIGKPRRLVGGIFFYLGILLFFHAHLFGKLHSGEPNILGTTWDLLASDIKQSQVSSNVGGGMVGALLYHFTYFLIAQPGSYLVAVLLLIVGAFLFSNLEGYQLLEGIQTLGERLQGLLEGDPAKQAKKQAEKAERKEQRAQAREAKRLAAQEAAEAEIAEMEKNRERQQTRNDEPDELPATETNEPSFVPINSFQEQMQTKPPIEHTPTQTTLPIDAHEGLEEEVPEDDGSVLEFEIAAEEENHAYELPSVDLLDSIPAVDQSDEYKKIEKNIGVLEQTFQSFGVDAKVVKASLGPSVTKFEVQPAVGVKVSKIVNLTDDIALALAAKDVRMEAPIPGKSLIGIEVPNGKISMVSFREVIEAQPKHPDKLLEVPLGRDVSGRVQTADLSKMPHLLVAGSTGSGKSVAINGIITSILMQAKPHEVKLMMIDPKMVELNMYNGIPHLLTPVVTNPRKAAQALQKVVQEMEERYEKFAATGVRNISGYNEFVQQKNLEDGTKHPTLPFIVVIVDELADLMMVASNEVEDAIIRLAQMARAAGIHMILATQRPSVDVITGIIKANVPSRMAFAVSSGTDSRTIIDSNGAEKLLGRGDMLFLPMGENKPIRVQGAFISDHEVERVVSFVTAQQEARYEEKMMPTDEVETTGTPEQPQDELYEEAKALVVEMQTASISLLQRRFRIGYNRAARLVDELETHGVVGPSEGSKPRKVFIEQLEDSMNDLPEGQPEDHL
ncbi:MULTISPECIES: DNA translocase FtsK [Enterococcus]|uniref:DNA translocase FtsK n=1 Tax=Enterococcus thailandicus TaxID=417368 RepID=A0A179ESZ0_ENTTH|nr:MULTISPECIES: DNA translocase FtsK [Enterococcus]ASZ08206.1 DNA translocase FtsK [Enterococcus thailandicus]MDA3973937.1 DNA translocase FtsK [Enterococcus thailandicus]MDA3976253.1 DNA translocase FtsK [Enterococcus thailandicus]MDA3981218.1 DNA translocase FtsK [Enterococcus thailandicus]MDK4352856.1 DNA translocase FtsK [Enterococcus thailandicus]